MSLKRRGNTWWTRFTAPDGQRIQQSTGTSNKTLAQQYEDQLKSDLWKVQKLGDKPSYSWQDAVVRYVREQAHLAGINNIKAHLRWIDEYWNNKILSEITRDDIDLISQEKAKTVTNTTVNRMLEVIRTILRRAAHDWEWIEKAPKVRMMPVDNRRIRWIKKEEANALLNRLPFHLSAMAGFTLATGLREANVCGLEWSQLDMQRRVAWIHPDQAKTRKAIPVPLNQNAIDIIRQQIGKHDTFVFTYKRGKDAEPVPINRANTAAWRKALADVGIEDFRWHDLRHTWASWHVQSGTPLHALQELGGWTSYEMVQRYAHLSAAHLEGFAENVGIGGIVNDLPG